ncbi:MAG: hypothetical protein ACKVT2_15755 [Saprospiraceae bacterium]
MKHVYSSYIFLLVFLAAQNVWGQTTDPRPSDSTRYRSIVSDRINEMDEQERGPSISKLLKKANESFGKKNFYAASKYYSFVLNPEPLHVEALKGYGESALAISSLDSAEAAFQRLVDHNLSPSPDYFPKFRLAEVKFRKGKYSEALELYTELAKSPQVPPIPDDLKKKAAKQLELCLWAQGAGMDNPYLIKDDTCYLLDTANVNTRELYSEYVSNIRDGRLYFSAYRFDFKKDRSNPKRNTIKLLAAEDARKKLGPSESMVVSESELNDLKRQHTAHLSFDETGNTVFYALGDYVRDSADIRFELFRRKKQTDGSWGVPEKLNAANAAGYTTTEPNFGYSGKDNKALFFVSDRPGGKGGKDIWYCNLFGDSLGAPKPLSQINTPGNDVTPFYHIPSGNLFFSTDSLPSLGGFDVYKTRLTNRGVWESPEHMGTPINSAANDVFFVLDYDSKRGFFSSNRIGSVNYSEEGCCYDIYSADFLIRYRAIALHDLTHKSLPFTHISLNEIAENGTFIPVETPPADSSSVYTFNPELNRSYALVAKKEGFMGDTLLIKTPRELWTREIVDTLYLRPPVNLIASVYDADTDEPIYGATTTFFDLGYQSKSGDFVKSGSNGKAETLADNSNTKNYTLDFEHKYRVLAAKEGYVSKTSKADSSEIVSTIGNVVGGTYEVKLYLHKPSLLENYLPITLYFDNDFPKRIRATDPQLEDVTDPFLIEMKKALQRNPKDPKYQDTILLDYQKTFVDYIRKKKEYKNEFTNVLSGQKKLDELDSIEYFFEQEVRMNWDSFFSFSDKIDLMLQNGDTIILTLKGYASPLSNPDYNFHLTNRRIASVYNHFMFFDNVTFSNYREVGGNGQLRFNREANGDATSPPNMNKDPKNRRLSVYDYKVARERRVQIVGAKVSKGSKEKKKL